MREKVHHYRYCPKCKANVEPFFRFCRSCFFWLAKPNQEPIRGLAPSRETEAPSRLSKYWVFENLFQSFVGRFSSALVLIAMSFAIVLYYTSSLLPTWMLISPRLKKNTCYANMRVIQTALEGYLMDQKFTPQLGRNPTKFLYDAKCLRNLPSCPIPGNQYSIPKGSLLQCVGSEGHGIP